MTYTRGISIVLSFKHGFQRPSRGMVVSTSTCTRCQIIIMIRITRLCCPMMRTIGQPPATSIDQLMPTQSVRKMTMFELRLQERTMANLNARERGFRIQQHPIKFNGSSRRVPGTRGPRWISFPSGRVHGRCQDVPHLQQGVAQCGTVVDVSRWRPTRKRNGRRAQGTAHHTLGKSLGIWLFGFGF